MSKKKQTPRNSAALAAKMRKAGPMKDDRTKRDKDKNWQDELTDYYADPEEEWDIKVNSQKIDLIIKLKKIYSKLKNNEIDGSLKDLDKIIKEITKMEDF